jgi:Sigma-70 factor, region 1.2
MTTDSLQLLLRDIGKVRLLTAQEEVALAKPKLRVKNGCFEKLGVTIVIDDFHYVPEGGRMPLARAASMSFHCQQRAITTETSCFRRHRRLDSATHRRVVRSDPR